MTQSDFVELTKEYEKAYHAYHNYMDQFFTTYKNGELIHEATKSYSVDEIKIIDELRDKLNELESNWLNIIRNGKVFKN